MVANQILLVLSYWSNQSLTDWAPIIGGYMEYFHHLYYH